MKLQLNKPSLKAVLFACVSIAISTPKLDSMYFKTKEFFVQNRDTYTKVAENHVVQDKEKRIEKLSELFDNLQLIVNTLPKLKKIEVTLLSLINYSGAINNPRVIETIDWVIDLSNILNRINKNLSKVRSNNYISFNETQEKIYRNIAKNSVSIISISRELQNIKKSQLITDFNLSHKKSFSDNEKLAISSLSNSLKG